MDKSNNMMTKGSFLDKTKELMSIQNRYYDDTNIDDKNLVSIYSSRMDKINGDITLDDPKVNEDPRLLKKSLIELLNTDENNVKRKLLVDSTLVNEETYRVDPSAYDKYYFNDATENVYNRKEILCRSKSIDDPYMNDFLYIKDVYLNGIMVDPMTSYRSFDSKVGHKTGTDRIFLQPTVYKNRLQYLKDNNIITDKDVDKYGKTRTVRSKDKISIITRRYPRISDKNFYQIINIKGNFKEGYERKYRVNVNPINEKGNKLNLYDGRGVGNFGDYTKNLMIYRYNSITGYFDPVAAKEYCFINEDNEVMVQFYTETKLSSRDIYMVVNKLKFFNIELDTFYDKKYRVGSKDYLDSNYYITSFPLLYKGPQFRQEIMDNDRLDEKISMNKRKLDEINEEIKNKEIDVLLNPDNILVREARKYESYIKNLEKEKQKLRDGYYKNSYFYNIEDTYFSEYLKDYCGIRRGQIPIPVTQPEELHIFINGLKLIPRLDYTVRRNSKGYYEVKFAGVIENGAHVIIRTAYNDSNTNYYTRYRNFQGQYFNKVRDSHIPMLNKYTEMYAGRRRIERTDKNVLVDNIIHVQNQNTTKNLEVFTTIPPSNSLYHTVRYYKDHATTLSEISNSFYRDIIQLYKRDNKIIDNVSEPGNSNYNKGEIFMAVVDTIQLFSNMNIVPEGETPKLNVFGTVADSTLLPDDIDYSLDITDDCTITDISEKLLRDANEIHKIDETSKDKYEKLTGKAIIELQKDEVDNIENLLHPDKEYKVIEAVYNIIIDEERGAPRDMIYLEVVPKAIVGIDLVTDTNIFKVGDNIRNSLMIKVTYDDGTVRYYKDDRDSDISESRPNEYEKCRIDAPEIATISDVGIRECKATYNYSYDKINDAPRYVTAYKNILITDNTEREIDSIKILIKEEEVYVDTNGNEVKNPGKGDKVSKEERQKCEVIISYDNNLVQHLDSSKIDVYDIANLSNGDIKDGNKGTMLDPNNLKLEPNKEYNLRVILYSDDTKTNKIDVPFEKTIIKKITLTEASVNNLNKITVNGQLLMFDQRVLDELDPAIKYYRVKTLNNNYMTIGTTEINKEAIYFGDLINYKKSNIEKGKIKYNYVIVEFYGEKEENDQIKEGELLEQKIIEPINISHVNKLEAILTGNILDGYVLSIPNGSMRLTEKELNQIKDDIYITDNFNSAIKAKFLTATNTNRARIVESENSENGVVKLFFNDRSTASMSAYGIRKLIINELEREQKPYGEIKTLKLIIPYTRTDITIKHEVVKGEFDKINYKRIKRQIIGSVTNAVLVPELREGYEVKEIYEISTKNFDKVPRNSGDFIAPASEINIKLGALTEGDTGIIDAENQSGTNIYVYELQDEKGNIVHDFIEIEKVGDRLRPMIYNLRINGSKNLLELKNELNKNK